MCAMLPPAAQALGRLEIAALETAPKISHDLVPEIKALAHLRMSAAFRRLLTETRAAAAEDVPEFNVSVGSKELVDMLDCATGDKPSPASKTVLRALRHAAAELNDLGYSALVTKHYEPPPTRGRDPDGYVLVALAKPLQAPAVDNRLDLWA